MFFSPNLEVKRHILFSVCKDSQNSLIKQQQNDFFFELVGMKRKKHIFEN